MLSIAELTKRLDHEFEEAAQRIEALRERASQEAEGIADRYEEFEELRQHVVEHLIQPRLDALVSRFDNVVETPRRSRLGAELLLAFAHTPQCPAKVDLKLSLTHDDRIEHVILTYDLKILPVFIKFKQHESFEFPLDELNEDAVSQWLDDRLVEFVQTYLSMQFVDQYQRENLVTDPVANLRFPKAFATTTSDYQGHTYYFLSDESREEFDKDPTLYVTTS